jgi:hypothetical protein
MQNIEITSEDLKQVLKEQHNWKAPGPDGMQNYFFYFIFYFFILFYLSKKNTLRDFPSSGVNHFSILNLILKY